MVFLGIVKRIPGYVENIVPTFFDGLEVVRDDDGIKEKR
jgi:hypothetical protein